MVHRRAVLSALPLVLLAVRGLHEPVPLPLLAATPSTASSSCSSAATRFERIRQLADG